MRISDLSSDVCSSDPEPAHQRRHLSSACVPERGRGFPVGVDVQSRVVPDAITLHEWHALALYRSRDKRLWRAGRLLPEVSGGSIEGLLIVAIDVGRSEAEACKFRGQVAKLEYVVGRAHSLEAVLIYNNHKVVEPMVCGEKVTLLDRAFVEFAIRSEECRVGKEWVSTFRSRLSPSH